MESANAQFKLAIENATKAAKSRGKRTRKSSSLDRQRQDSDKWEIDSTGSLNKKAFKTGGILFSGYSNDMMLTHPPPGTSQLRNEGSKKREGSKKKTPSQSGTETSIPSKTVEVSSLNFSKRERSPGHQGQGRTTLKASLEKDRLESNYFRNCSNIYFAYGHQQQQPARTSVERRSRDKEPRTGNMTNTGSSITYSRASRGERPPQRPAARSKSKDSVEGQSIQNANNVLAAKLAALGRRYKKLD